MNIPKNIFKDLIVVEFASVLAGPAVGMFFAELGAQVIKIENARQQGDVTRSWKLKGENAKEKISSYYASINWGKTSLQLDLTQKEGLQTAKKWIARADVLISNFKQGSAEKLGLAYHQLKTEFPGLIYAQLEAFGVHAPNRLAYDVILQAEAGYISMTGTSLEQPAKLPIALIDVLAAHQLKEGILVAMIQKMKTGNGALVRASLFDAAIASLVNQASGHLMTGHLPVPMGTQHPNIAPYGDIFWSKDELPLILAIGSQGQFEKLLEVLNLSQLSDDPRFVTNQVRLQNRKALVDLLQEKIGSLERSAFLSNCHQKGIPAAAIKNLQEVFQDPQMKRLILSEMREGLQTLAVRSVVFEME